MIPIHKLEKLPRTLRLRKIANMFGGAEFRFAASGCLHEAEAEHLCKMLDLLAGDESFSAVTREALAAAHARISSDNTILHGKSKESAERNSVETRRAINTVHHLLLSETGRYQADWDFVEFGGVLDPSKRRPFAGMQVYLEDIRSPFNVGAMFRAAESFGAEKIWLSPLCADPRHKRAERTAMGCVDVIPWEKLRHDPFGAVSGRVSVQEEAVPGNSDLAPPFPEGPFFALETGGVPLGDFPFPARGILIAGSEELGVSPRALAAADASLGRVTIPTWGAKGSLNVSVAFGIVMQAWAARLAKY